MELSKEDRDRIYAEEKTREAARKELKRAENRRKNKKILYWFLGIFAFFMMMIIINPPKNDTPAPRNMGNEACLAARDFVERTLKAPSTAEFAPLSESNYATNYKDKTVYTVNSYVDAQNSFGAKIRTRFTVTMKYEPTTDTWSLLSLKTDP